MTKRIIFISNSVIPKKDAGGGSVLIYRHLMRLKEAGFEVIVVRIGRGTDYFDSFQYVFLNKKPWYPFLRKKTPFLTNITMFLYFKDLSKKINLDSTGDILIGILSEVSNLLLVNIFNRKKILFFLFYHDDNIFNRYWHSNLCSSQQLNSVLSKASFIFSVSEQMVELLHNKNTFQTSVLYPLPDSYKEPAKTYEMVNNRHLQFCYAGMAMHIHFNILDNITQAIEQINGQFYCFTGPLDGFQPKYPDNIVIKDRVAINELQKFIIQRIDVVIVFYSFDLQHEPRMESSFPSKFIEYAQLSIPILLIAPEYSSLGKWALKNNWISYVNSDDPDIIAKSLGEFNNKDYWIKCQQQVVEHINNEFNPEFIHNTFLNTIIDKSGTNI
ncbi:MAG: hypothetical protein JWR05_2547 [Mucilaginibacter sp.]|nr:hypothetical protein [Mucilaginibacter sp.]